MERRERPARRRTNRLIVAAAVTVLAAVVGAAAAPAPAVASAPLRVHADALGLHIGAVVDPQRLFSDKQYQAIVAREFNSITPADTFTWDVIHPSMGAFNFSRADQVILFAQKHGQLVRGSPLVWHEQNPAWLLSLSASFLAQVLAIHIHSVVGNYHGQVAHWDVVNEPLGEDGLLRDSIWLQGLGPGYIAEALQHVRAADPNATLYLNDYGIAAINTKSTGMYMLAQDLLMSGVPLDGIGVQGRFQLGGVPSNLAQNLQRFTNLGLEVSITQLEIAIQLPATAQELQQQAMDYRTVIEACVAVSGCAGVTLGGVADPPTWIPGSGTGYVPGAGFGAAFLWDGSFLPKPAYHGVHDALAGAM